MADSKNLGRGLDAIFGSSPRSENDTSKDNSGGGMMVPITEIAPNPDQPRRVFDQAALDALASSLKQDGLIQPILVRPSPPDSQTSSKYQIIAGERRWRASQIAGLHEIPIQVRETDERQSYQLALIENLQREDLNAIEQAQGYRVLMEKFSYTQEELAKAIGVSRPNIANTLRLLKLSADISRLVSEGKLSAGHARCLVGLDENVGLDLAQKTISQGLGVRKLEKLCEDLSANTSKKSSSAPTKPAEIADLERALSEQLGMQVSIAREKKESGRVTIRYSRLDQFDTLMARLVGNK